MLYVTIPFFHVLFQDFGFVLKNRTLKFNDINLSSSKWNVFIQLTSLTFI